MKDYPDDPVKPRSGGCARPYHRLSLERRAPSGISSMARSTTGPNGPS